MNSLNVAFASDNTAGAHPKILEAMTKANQGYCKPYGYDEYCEQSDSFFHKIFGEDIDVCLALNGTGANVLALKAMLRPWEAVICTDIAHINTDEAGAPEHCLGAKILAVPSINGKIKPQDIDIYLADRDTIHRATPAIVSITQSTERGTLYTLEELKNLCAYAHKNNLLVHMDGARLANACASLGVDMKTISKDVGVDVLSLGGAKNGLVFGEAIVFFDRKLAVAYGNMRKQSLQLISKMRFIATQFIEYLTNDLWLENAKVANEMAIYLAERLGKIQEIQVQKPDVNAVFVKMPKSAMHAFMEKYYCYEIDPSEVRLMTSFATKKEDVDTLVECLSCIIAKNSRD